MSGQSNDESRKIQEFVKELAGFADTAESTLKTIEENLEGNKGMFSIFYEKMFAIRGTADQLNLPHISHIAGLGEEISIKATSAETRPQIRKCVSSLWDALTTVKYLLEHYTEETQEEQQILVHRLENTLRVLGGARPKMSPDQIEEMLRKKTK